MKFIKFRNIYSFIVLFFIYIFIFLLNTYTSYYSDDYIYHFFYNSRTPNKDTHSINGIYELIASQVSHWQLKNGRFIGHTICQILMQFDKRVFNLINTFIFCLLIYGICILVNKTFLKQKNSSLSFFVLFLLLYFFIPEFGLSVLWVSGSSNYLWTGLIHIYWLLFFFSNERKSDSIFLIIASIVFSFISGASNENTGPAIIMIIFVNCIFYFLKYRKIEMWKILSLFSGVFGTILCISSPSSQKRAGIFFDKIIIMKNFVSVFKMQWDCFNFLLILITFLLVVGLYRKKLVFQDFKIIFVFLIGYLIAVFSMIIPYEHPPRTLFGACLFLSIIFLYLFEKILIDKKFMIFLYPLLFISIFIFIGSYSQALLLNILNQRIYNEGLSIINKSKIIYGNEAEVSIPIIPKTNSNYSVCLAYDNICESKESWPNLCMAKFYGIKSITGYYVNK